ncbi:MAG: rhomboid family intramembrane serine protease [Candidatus Nanohaloarchaea archaeon]
MAECSKCGKETMSFTCRYCGKKFCSEHRLPENHDCEKMEEEVEKEREETGKWFRKKDTKEEVVRPSTPAKPSLLKDVARSLKNNVTFAIITVTVLSFLLQYIVPGYYEFLTLSPALTTQAAQATNSAFGGAILSKTFTSAPWTLATVMLAHGGFFHIFANMVTFYFFGSVLERSVGSRTLLKFYLASGLAASVGYIVFRNFLFYQYGPVLGGVPALGPAVGASGAVVAVFAVVAMLYPQAEVLLYFFIPMKIRTALYLFGGIETVNLLSKMVGYTLPAIGNFASSAHLTGLVIGVWYGRKLQKRYAKQTGVIDLLGY